MAENPTTSLVRPSSLRCTETRIDLDDLLSAFKTTAVVHALLIILTALMLANDQSDQMCIIAMIGYWVATLFILIRRHNSLTRLDFWFIRYGVIAIWFAVPWIAEIVYYFIGKSTERGIDRLL